MGELNEKPKEVDLPAAIVPFQFIFLIVSTVPFRVYSPLQLPVSLKPLGTDILIVQPVIVLSELLAIVKLLPPSVSEPQGLFC